MLLQYMKWASAIKISEKHPLGLSCSLDFRYFTTHFWHFSMYSSHFYHDVRCLAHTTHHYLSHWTCNHTWIASNNVIFCMSCYYHSHLIIPYLAQVLGFRVTCGAEWCHYVMVEADSHLKLLPTSILDMYKAFEHIDMLSMGIQYQPYTVIPRQ